VIATAPNLRVSFNSNKRNSSFKWESVDRQRVLLDRIGNLLGVREVCVDIVLRWCNPINIHLTNLTCFKISFQIGIEFRERKSNTVADEACSGTLPPWKRHFGRYIQNTIGDLDNLLATDPASGRQRQINEPFWKMSERILESKRFYLLYFIYLDLY